MARSFLSFVHGKVNSFLHDRGWGGKPSFKLWWDWNPFSGGHGHGPRHSHEHKHGGQHKDGHKPPTKPENADGYDYSELLGEEARNVDGTGNNQTNTGWGSAGSALLRVSPATYSDGAGAPYQGVNPRDISNTILDQDTLIPNSFGVSDLFTYFGQFIDHDIDLTPEGHTETISFTHADGDFSISRSGYLPGTGTDPSNPREYPNVITSFVDGSNIYGSHSDVTSVLRAEGGTSPYLLTSDGGYAPTLGQITAAYPDLDPNNVGGGPLAAGGANPALFVAGDVRANENIALTSMHTIWVREHNYQVDRLKEYMPDAGNDELFKMARLLVEAEYQNIVFNEYLPLLLGAQNIPAYQGYDQSVDAGVAIEFSTAAYRLGHSQLSPTLARLYEDGSEIAEGSLGLFEAFFRPDQLLNGGIDALVRGLAANKGQEIDENIIDDVRNLLFGGTNATPIDLGVFNLLRGYDHGVPTLNEVRVAYGLAPLTSFSDLTSNAAVAAQFAQVYTSIDEVELWPGGLAEDKFPGSQLGETFHTIVLDQFIRFRDGDRFYFEERLKDHPELLEYIKGVTLSEVIVRTTDIDYFQDDAFIAHNRIGGGGGRDTLYGTEDHDLIIGFDGKDTLYGKDGDDDLYGGKGNDKLHGGWGRDVLFGEQGNDKLYGGEGDDGLYGGKGNDKLHGGWGEDMLDGGPGRDVLFGGPDADTFVLSDVDAKDLIADYDLKDLIDLTALLDVLDTDGAPGLTQGDVDEVVHYWRGVLSVNDQSGSGFQKVAYVDAAGGGTPPSVRVLVDDGAGNEGTFIV